MKASISKSLQLSPYISSILPSPDSSQLLVATATELTLVDAHSLHKISSLPVTDGTQIRYDQNGIWYSNRQGCALMDVRSGSVVRQFTNEPILSFSVNASNTTLATGTELVGDDAKIAFWDLRSTTASPIQEFTEVHSDDITQIVFHPSEPNCMISGSTDGLLCLYNLSEPGEDEALYQVIKDNSINKIGFFGPTGEYLYSTTHIETLSLWKFTQGEKLVSFGDVRPILSTKDSTVDYLVDTYYGQDRLYTSYGNYTGDFGIAHVTLGSLEPLITLKGGHSEMIRAMCWSPSSSVVVSGCEEGKLVQWRVG